MSIGGDERRTSNFKFLNAGLRGESHAEQQSSGGLVGEGSAD